ncbi:hypothetical protein LINGRAPRIM_LOCUS2416 [Linum grandiflorum]
MEDTVGLVEATRHGVVSIYIEGTEQPSYVGDNEDDTSGWDQPFDADDSVVGAHVGVVHLISDSDRTSDEEFLRAMDNLGISQYRRKYHTTYMGDGVEVDMTTERVGVNERVGLNDINEARPEGINDMNRVDNTPLQHESDGDHEESEDSDLKVGEQTLNNSPASSYRGSSDSDHDVADKIEGDEVNSMQGWIYYDTDCDHKQLELKPKLRFLNPTQFKEAVVNYTVARGADIYWVHSSKKNKEVVCAVQGCPWRVYASWFGNKEAFVIKSVGEDHACPRTTYIRSATAKWIARRFLHKFRFNPTIDPKVLMVEMKHEADIDVSLRVCVNAKNEARNILDGSLYDTYAKLRTYILQLKKSDPEGTFLVEVDRVAGNDTYVLFRRMYVGFSCLRKGFVVGCRRMFALDGCFLKGEVKGMLLSAVGKDGNNQMYPIVWAVVESENRSSWTWFISILQEELGFADGT